MKIFRAFLLRLSQIIAVTAAIDFTLMGLTLGLNQIMNGLITYLIIGFICLLWVIFAHFLINRTDPELVSEVAKFLFPSGAIVAIAISVLLAYTLAGQLPEIRRQHYVVIMAGLGIAGFLIIRCFDIRWLRSSSEIADKH